MTVLITGGTGFTGAEVARILLEKGEKKPVLFDIAPSFKRLDGIDDKVRVVEGDLGNFKSVLDVIQRTSPRVIYHLGGMLSVPSDENPAGALRTNALGTFHILEAARLYHVPKVLFSSTIVTYGLDIKEEMINDATLQRPQLFYGATKLFCEHMGLFYKRKYNIDFRSIRYPSIVGPGVKTQGIAQFTSWVIEESYKGNPFTITLKPETKIPIIYFKDAAKALVQLGDAPLKAIKTVNYIVAGVNPTASAGELSDIVRAKIPGARIRFEPNLAMQNILAPLIRPLDDSNAQREWGWRCEYDQEGIVNDFLLELQLNSKRYA